MITKTNEELIEMLSLLSEQYDEKKNEVLFYMNSINDLTLLMNTIHENYIKCVDVLKDRGVSIGEEMLK